MCSYQGKIAFFDSGIGGFSVMRSCENVLNDYQYYYYGDAKNAPYGNLSNDVILRYTLRAFEEFEKLKVDAAVIACNTVTAVCVEELRRRFPFSIIGAEPAILPATKNGGLVYVLTTRATYNSSRFERLIAMAKNRYPSATIVPFSVDKLAGYIEENYGNPNADYTPFLPKGKPEGVVLGCTHYVLIKRQIQAFYGVKTYDGNDGILRRLQTILSKKISAKSTLFDENIIKNEPFLHRSGQNLTPIFFLGDSKMVIKNKYEQMFAKKNTQNGQ